MLVQRRPRAQIVPAEIRRDAVNVGLALALCRARLQNRIVYADVLALWIELSKGLLELAAAVAVSNFLEQRRGFRQVLAQRVGERLGAPEKHAAVPEEIPSLHELLGNCRTRFLGETLHPHRTIARLAADLNVAVPSLRASRLDTDDHDVRAGCRDLRAPLDVVAKTLLVEDDVVGREQPDHCCRIESGQQKCGKSNRGRGIASDRLSHNLLLLQLLELAKNLRTQVIVGNNPELLVFRERLKTLDRLLDHALLAVQWQQLLGHTLAAEWPEARTASTGENDGIKVEIS